MFGNRISGGGTVLGILGLLVAACLEPIYSQDSVFVSINLADRATDTLDFGYVMAGDTVIRPLYIENNSSGEVVIPQGVRPYMWIESVPSFRENDPDEFPLEALFPFRVGATQIRTYPLRYTATLFAQHPEGLHRVALNVSIRAGNDPERVLVQRRFILQATKSFRPLWSDHSRLEFDSVYVHSPFVRTLILPVRNVMRRSVPVTIIRSGDRRSREAFAIDTDDADIFASEELKEYVVRFQPTTAGLYAMDVLWVHPSPLRGGALDTTQVQLRGVGVHQRLEYRIAASPAVQLAGDTIIARLRPVGRSDTLRLIFQNTGNIRIGAVETRIIGQSSSPDITIVRGFGSIDPLAFDTLIIAVRPSRSGRQQATIELYTDVRTRAIFGVPPGAEVIRFPLVVESQQQRLIALATGIDFGKVALLGGCSEQRRDTVRIINQGVQVDTIWAAIVTSPFEARQQFPIAVAPGETITIPLQVSTVNREGRVEGTLRLETSDSAYSPLEIPLRVHFIAPGPLTLRVDSITYTPGRNAYVPIIADSSLWLYSAVRFDIAFDPTMAEYYSTLTAGTAAQNAQVEVSPSGVGVYTVRVASAYPFIPADTLIVLVLRTYLGEQPQAPIRLTQVRSGTSLCSEVVAGVGNEGYLRVEPFCGMGYKYPIALPSLVLQKTEYVARDLLLVECWSQYDQDATVELYASDGRKVATEHLALRTGHQMHILPFDGPAGFYLVRLYGAHSGEGRRHALIVR